MWNLIKTIIRPTPKYRIITDGEFFKVQEFMGFWKIGWYWAELCDHYPDNFEDYQRIPLTGISKFPTLEKAEQVLKDYKIEKYKKWRKIK